MAEEQTLVLVKPDGVAQGHIGEVITRIERRGFTIEALKVTQATSAQLHQHYAALVDKPFFPKIERFMTSGPLVAMIVSGFNVIEAVRTMTGATNPGDAAPGTIRGTLVGNGPIRRFATLFTAQIAKPVRNVRFQFGLQTSNMPLKPINSRFGLVHFNSII